MQLLLITAKFPDVSHTYILKGTRAQLVLLFHGMHCIVSNMFIIVTMPFVHTVKSYRRR